MNIDRIHYFCTVAETGSLAKAAEIHRISQPALSKALSLLQQETGLKLVVREGRGLSLTPVGVQFKNSVQPLLERWMSLPNQLKDAGKTQSVIKLGSFEVFTTYFIGHWLKNYSAEMLEIHELGPGKIEEAIVDGSVDIGITYIPIPKQGIEYKEVTRIRMGVFGRACFRTTPVSELPFAVPLHPPHGTPTKVTGLDGWPDQKYGRKIKFRVAMMESALELCRNEFAVAYLPSFVVKLHNKNLKTDHQLIELECPVSKRERLQSVYLIQRSSSEEGALVRSIAKALRSFHSVE